MADYSMMTSNPNGPFGLGGVNPQQQALGGTNPYMRAAGPYDQFGAGAGGQGGPIPLGQPDANGVTLQQLQAPDGGATLAQKQALAKALMAAAGNGNDPNVGAVQPLGSLPPGIIRST